ncbi:MAG: HAD family phosphatase [Sedimentisphaerales bacterium]|nr:HAD family phosphatase [Sedimentisphaerales bacterium]
MPQQIQYGLIFDVDGVIADTEGINARASIRMFEELFGLAGVCRDDFEKGLGRGAAAYVRAAAQVHGFEMTEEQVKQATHRRQENIVAILKKEPSPAFPGVLDLMHAAMESTDFRVAIATSSSRAISEAVLKAAQIPYQNFTYITGSDVTRKKPDPELFLTAAARSGIDPTRCVVFEDAPDGVKAAKAAGAKCIAITNSATADKLTEADRIVDSLAQIDLETIRRLLSA